MTPAPADFAYRIGVGPRPQLAISSRYGPVAKYGNIVPQGLIGKRIRDVVARMDEPAGPDRRAGNYTCAWLCDDATTAATLFSLDLKKKGKESS